MLIDNRYEFGNDHYFGGMGQVLNCYDLVLERQVAIKFMPGNANRRRINDEVSALFRMRSKNVVQVYDILEFKGELGIVMEYISGDDLLHNSTRPVSLLEYLKLLWQIASGIADIHQAGIIHRDIKPNNMKIDPEGLVKIFDFGLARDAVDGAATLGFIGTPCFAAPEQYGYSVRFTSAIDTYAFGATALYIAARDLPSELRAEPPLQLRQNYFQNIYQGLSQDVVGILFSCLNFDPALRPPMSIVRDVLAKHLLQGRHRALVVYNGNPSFLDASNRSVLLSLPGFGSVEISYNDFDFVVTATSGQVFINNRAVYVGFILPGASVVALGGPEHGSKRRYITFDLSHPEIVL